MVSREARLLRSLRSPSPTYEMWNGIHVDEYSRKFYFPGDHKKEIAVRTLLTKAHFVQQVVFDRYIDGDDVFKSR